MSESNGNEDGLWTAEQVAQHLQVAEGTVNQWVKLGQIPVVKVGRLNRFRPDDIRRWVDERAQPAGPPEAA